MTKFPKAQFALTELCRWLAKEKRIPADLGDLRIRYDKDQDNRNQKDPRAFCFTSPGSHYVHATMALDYLPDTFLTGILLHEVGHIHLDAFKGAESEVLVDAWCTNIPDSGYGYELCRYYSPFTSEILKAPNLEHVALDFARKILGRDAD